MDKMILNVCLKNNTMVDENICKDCKDTHCRHAGEPTTRERLDMGTYGTREVYVPLDNEVVDGVPVPFIEYSEFWNTHGTDEGFILVYVDKNNRIVK